MPAERAAFLLPAGRFETTSVEAWCLSEQMAQPYLLRIRLEIGLISDVAVWEGAEVLFQHLYRLLQRKVAGPIRENEFVQLAFLGHAQIPFQVAGQVLQYIGMPSDCRGPSAFSSW